MIVDNINVSKKDDQSINKDETEIIKAEDKKQSDTKSTKEALLPVTVLKIKRGN